MAAHYLQKHSVKVSDMVPFTILIQCHMTSQPLRFYFVTFLLILFVVPSYPRIEGTHTGNNSTQDPSDTYINVTWLVSNNKFCHTCSDLFIPQR